MTSQRDRSSDTQGHVGSMDIWHAAGTVEMGPDHRSVITGVNFGRGLPWALHCKGVPASELINHLDGAFQQFDMIRS